MRLPLHMIRYSQDSIGCTFHDGTSVDDLIDQLLQDEDYYDSSVPLMHVVEEYIRGKKVYFSLDNRRLFALTEALPSNFRVLVLLRRDSASHALLERKSRGRFERGGFGRNVHVRRDRDFRDDFLDFERDFELYF